MKKLTTIIAALFLLCAASAFTPIDVSSKVKAVFEQDFSPVSAVKWTSYENIYVASFKEKGANVSAAYTLEGQLICTGRSIELSQLPLNVTRALENKYAGYKINPEVVEMSTDVTYYVIYAENNKFKLKISADPSGNLMVENKTKKKK